MIPVNAHIEALAPYALADLTLPAGVEMISMAQNESLRPPSPLAIAALQDAAGNSAFYPDPDWCDLRTAIATVHNHNIAAEQLLCGAGTMELIGCIAQAYAGPEARVLSGQYGYALFPLVAQIAQAACDLAPAEQFTVSAEAYLATVRPATRLVFIANPGNPTGTRLSRNELVYLRDNLADDILLVIDEAYGEFADDLDLSMADLVERGNTVILRTFSKAYGLAGARVGWGLFPPAVAAEIRKLLNPNNVSTASQAAATAAMLDQSYMRETCAQTIALRNALQTRLRQLGLDCPDSYTNFLLINFNSAAAADRANKSLRAQGIIMRGLASYGLPHCLRATIVSEQAMQLAGDILQQWSEQEGE